MMWITKSLFMQAVNNGNTAKAELRHLTKHKPHKSLRKAPSAQRRFVKYL